MEQTTLLTELFGDISDLDEAEILRSGITPGPAPGDPGQRAAPRVGTTIQRGDATARRRAAFLADPPNPAKRAPRRVAPAAEKTTRPTTDRTPKPPQAALRRAYERPPGPMGPRPGTPVCAAVTRDRPPGATSPRPVSAPAVPHGHPPAAPRARAALADQRFILPNKEEITVPWSAIYRNRKYRARTPSGIWVLRFDPQGNLRMCRRK